MNEPDIAKLQKKADAIRDFKELYSGCVLYGRLPDYQIDAEQLICFLIEHPHFAEIAAEIADK